MYVLSYQSYICIGLLVVEIAYLLKHSKRLVVYALVICLIVTYQIARIDTSSNNELPESGQVIEVYEDSFILKNQQSFLCYHDGYYQLEPGMIIEFDGVMIDDDGYEIMNTFDYTLYLRSQGVSQAIYINSIEVTGHGFHPNIIKHRINEYITENYQEDSAHYIRLFVLGIKDEEFKADSAVAKELGITHLFAISGMHLGLMVGMLTGILKPLYLSKKTTKRMVMLFLVAYNIITGFKVSIMRASILIIVVYVIEQVDILLTKTDIVSLTFLLFVIINPYIVYSLGFQLSYLIALSLLLGNDILKSKSRIISIAKTTLFATFWGLPLTLASTHQIGLVFIYANIFLILYISYIFLPATIITLIVPKAEVLYFTLIQVFEKAITFFDEINILVDFNFPNNIYKLLFWGLLGLFFICYENRKKRLLALMGIILVFLLSTFASFESNRFVRFLDVGQGDAIHIHDNGCDMLIDTGSADDYDNLIKYFESFNVKTMDILLITHYHSDHYGELENILDEMTVEALYLPSDPASTNMTYQVLREGDCFSCGQSNFQVLSADQGDSNQNNNSLVLYALIGHDRYLFTGDIEEEVERKIIADYDFQVDILKVPHHGSDTSSSYEFLETLEAEVAIISVGKDNYYGHPASEIIKRYEDMNHQIYRTDTDGTITVYYLGPFPMRIVETYKKRERRHFSMSMV